MESKERFIYIDFLRTLAIFHMFFYHALIALGDVYKYTKFTNFFYQIILLCPAMFLFLSGFSLSFFGKKGKIKKYLRRSVFFIISASALFIIENGLQMPHAIFASGILNTLGWLSILLSLIIILHDKLLIYAFIFIVVTIMYLFLDIKKIDIFPFTTGYEPVFPTLIFGLAGALWGKINKIESILLKKYFYITTSLLSFAVIVFYFYKYGIFEVFYSKIGRKSLIFNFESGLLLQNLLLNINTKSMFVSYIWNYTVNSFFASLSFIVLIFNISYFIKKYFNNKMIKLFSLPGKYGIINYFFHLGTIALIYVILPVNYVTESVFYYILLLLFVFSYVISFFKNYFTRASHLNNR